MRFSRPGLAFASALTLALAASVATAAAGCGGDGSKPTPGGGTNPGADAGVQPTGAPVEVLPALALNDVSVLYPLPTLEAPGYLAAESTGDRGALLPKAIFDQIPKFPVVPADGLDFKRMRVVSVRFDGCFPAPQNASGCEAQIRLVMQPIGKDGTAKDSALHLFYRLADDELPAVVKDLRHLHDLAKDVPAEVLNGPLDVHPGLVGQGMEGPYAVGLNELVLRHAGEDNLTRMTFFLRAPPVNEVWFFGGFHVNGGQLETLDIVGVGKGNQRVIHTPSPGPEGGYAFDFLPVEKTPEDTSLLLSSDAFTKSAPADVTKALEVFARLDNPHAYGPDQLPCAGCHVSTAITGHAQTKFGHDLTKLAGTFTSTRDLTLRGGALKQPGSLRAFGWFVKEAMISQRVVNESAAVVDDFEHRFPREHAVH